ncbi:MAG: aminotransferase class III-fold pyridoxal phosphate-dependent enzyme [Luteitalea sp.]|nr:aminotransferase class III-fold pyridoxal phosphate-dependent enzyme [Luteitalea sp.]
MARGKLQARPADPVRGLRQVPGPRGKALLEEWRQYEAQTMTPQAPVVWDRARGMVVTDVDGNRYYDWTSGVLVTNVGHGHPRHVQAIQEAVATLMSSYDFATPARIALARQMVEITPPHLDRAFFLTTGSEAVEAALRVAKRYTGNWEIVSFYGGFHGRTWGAASVAGLAGPKKHFGPPVPGTIQAPFPYCYRCPLKLRPETCGTACLELMDSQVNASSTGRLAATIIEPYQGAAGFIFPPDGYLKALEQWTRERGMIFILDEVQSSFGRTGKMFALEWEDLTPQLLCLGKGIGSGIPTSALMAESAVIATVGPGEMSSTCGGNPVSSAAALAVLEIIRDEGLVENARRIGSILKARLLQVQEKCRHLGDVRGRGLVMGLEIVRDRKSKEPAADLTRRVIQRSAENGLLIGAVGIFGNVIRVAPPLVISENEAHESMDIMESVLVSL